MTWPLLVMALTLTMTVSRASELCPDGTYLDRISALCRRCTICPMNTIIRVPCKATSDTICGPFFEFTFFNNGGEAGDNQGMPEERIPDGPMTSSYRPDTDVAATNDDDRDVVEKNDDRWRELCFGLIGALAAVSSLAILYVIITHLRHRQGSCKNSSLDDSELPVVYYHTQLLASSPSPERGNSTRNLYTQVGEGDYVLHPHPPHSQDEDSHKCPVSAFLLHPSSNPEIQNWPLARVHNNYTNHVQRSRRQTSGCHLCPETTDGRQPAHVTEMLLSHHKCDADVS
ncbi:hypothetical protein LSH36_1130g00012 [Paralvinella palmiformis]|uniref:TNFR-Cys domain-containing protein n=1 Tax=Paralvinella palmiformis TaxID=53620 RepID=A0AAD9IVE2_9ANNE|nr:hypothetical protein LSH36_1130g00012 [Paralvinella palmiformis]